MSMALRRKQLRDFVERLAAMDPDEQRERIARLRPDELLMLDTAFEAWAHDAQLPPTDKGWRTWLMMAGRGFGKTRAGSEWIYELGWSRPVRIALVGATIDEARRVMVEGASGLLSIARRWRHTLKWEPSKGELTWPRGSVAQLYSGDNADGLRGPEHGFAWCDELAKWRQAEAAWDNLQMGLRAGRQPRALVTTTPRPMRLLEQIKENHRTVTSGGGTASNINLPREFIAAMLESYGGTRTGVQELEGKLLKEFEGSLWPTELIARSRCAVPDGGFDRVVVGVDPCASVGANADASWWRRHLARACTCWRTRACRG